MYDYKEEKYDWRTREDAETLRRSQEIRNDPERFNKAAAFLSDSIEQSKAVLKGGSPVSPCRSHNKATLKRL